MTFEEWIGDRINVLSPQEYHAVEAVWDYQQKIIDGFKQANNDLAKAAIRPDGYVLVPVEPTEKILKAARNAPMPLVHLDSFTSCSNLILKTQYKAMIKAAQEEE